MKRRSEGIGAATARTSQRIDEGDGFTIHVAGRPPIRARAVILAIPAFAAAELLRPIDADLSAACGSIRYLSTATVVFAFPRDAVRHDLKGTGFVVPRAEGISITAGAWISSKWPQRAPEGQALLRAFLGGARDPERAVEDRYRADQCRARRSDEDSRHPRAADHDARVSLESIEPATGSRTRRADEAHRREARRAIPGCSSRPPDFAAWAFPTASPMRAARRARPQRLCGSDLRLTQDAKTQRFLLE